MRLYHHPVSTSSRRVTMLAEHLGLPLDLVDINLLNPQDRARLVEVNPNSKIPVLVDGDLVLWESCAIMQYLAETTPGQTVYPNDPRGRAEVNRWLFWACQHFASTIGFLGFEHIWKGILGMGPADPAEVQRWERQFIQFATVLDRQLAGKRYVLGEQLTLADFALAAPLAYIDRISLPMDGFAHLNQWFERMRETKAWRNTEPADTSLLAA